MDDGWTVCALPLEPKLPRRVAVMARWLARKAVIEQLRVRGLNPTPAVMRDQTEAYLRQHWRTLIRQAETVLNKTQDI
jgi:hypothetical protein